MERYGAPQFVFCRLTLGSSFQLVCDGLHEVSEVKLVKAHYIINYLDLNEAVRQ